MHHLITLFTSVLSFVFIISVVVFIHEGGHYIVAKLAGVKIETFSIGFGRELFGWYDRSGTRWKISAVPAGGYVKMFGDASEVSTPLEKIAEFSPEEKSKTFYYKPLYKKAAIVIAGPLANFILTIVIMTAVYMIHGIQSTEPIIGEIIKDTPAQAAGLVSGDRIVGINGEKVEVFYDIPRLIMTNLGTPVVIDLVRAGEHKKVTLTPKEVKEKDDFGNDFTRPIIGFKSTDVKFKDVDLVEATHEAILSTYRICSATLEAIGQMITGDRSAKDSITGPIGIAKLSGQAAEKGIFTIFLFMANLSANLGLINLFPIPMLDGGHLLYYGVEAVRGRPLKRRLQEYGFRIGMAMIAMLMAFAILNDIRKYMPA